MEQLLMKMMEQINNQFERMDLRFDKMDLRFDSVESKIESLQETVDNNATEFRSHFRHIENKLDPMTLCLNWFLRDLVAKGRHNIKVTSSPQNPQSSHHER